jgi:hypothetical protein
VIFLNMSNLLFGPGGVTRRGLLAVKRV